MKLSQPLSLRTALSLSAIALCSNFSSAATIDLRTGQEDSGTINGAIFAVDTTGSGTGIFNLPAASVFATIQEEQGNPNNDPNGPGVQEGYNTSLANVMDVDRRPQWNHEILVSDLNVVVINGVDYVPFLLDINEANAGNKKLITLDDVQILTSPVMLSEPTLDGLLTNPNTTLRYELDAGGDDPDSWVLLDYTRSNSGSGAADMGLFVPLAAFGGASLAEYVYLYSRFGGDDASAVAGNTDSSAHAGFEEWTLGEGESIPEPSAALLGTIGTLLLLGRRSRK